jgi:hypothetical protein
MTRNAFYGRTAVGTRAREPGLGPRPRTPRYDTGFWLGAAAFAVIMASSAVSTPIYALYERRDHFGPITVTRLLTTAPRQRPGLARTHE